MTPIEELYSMLRILALSLPRMAAVFSVAPFMGGKLVHGMLRNAIIASMMLVLYPIVASTLPESPPQGIEFLALVVKELLVGLFIGLVAGIIFWAVQGAGFLVDMARGASMADIFDPLAGENTSILGSLLFQAATVLFFTTGGFLAFLFTLFQSYAAWPVASMFPEPGQEFQNFFLAQADLLMRYSLLLAAPIVIISFLIDLAMGFINRFAPQLNVFFLSMPIKSGVAVFVLVLYMATVFHYCEERFFEIGQTIHFLQGIMN